MSAKDNSTNSETTPTRILAESVKTSCRRLCSVWMQVESVLTKQLSGSILEVHPHQPNPPLLEQEARKGMQPPSTHARIKLVNGYPFLPGPALPGSGPAGHDKNYRTANDISQRFARNDAYFQDPSINGAAYPIHLAYRRKSGEFYTIPPKPADKSTPDLRIPPQSALYANMVLRYYGYYAERMPAGDPEFSEFGYRVRKVTIHFHMEDNTITVWEPALENFGMSQGLTCPRGRYYWPRNGILTDRQSYKATDFTLGNDYQIGHYLIHVYDADEFTKEFWAKQFPMDSIGEPEPSREDPGWVKAQSLRDRQNQLVNYKKNRKPLYPAKPYHFTIPNEEKMLFVGILDDTNYPLARCRPVAVEYYFVDETIRVMEYRIDNDAHQFGDTLNTVNRRGRIPNHIEQQQEASALGPIEKPTPAHTYYIPKDLFVGNTVWLYGRKILLVECTEWTRKWFDKHFKPEMPPNIEWRSKYQRRPHRLPRNIVIPPHNGLGTHEDSMKSVFEVQPQPRPPNELPQLCYSDDIFKYSAKLYSRHPDAFIPEYTILYYMADDTIAVFEKTVPGDASFGKKYLARQQCPMGDYQDGPFQRTPLPTPIYDWRSFLPGNVLNLWGTRFLLTLPDEHIFRVIEKHHMFTAEERDLIRKAIEDSKPPLPSPPVFLSEEQLKAQAMPRAAKCMQRIKYWILHNPKYLLLLLSEGDSGDACIITPELVEKVCKAGDIDCDAFSAQEIVSQARANYNKPFDEPLFVEEFLKYAFYMGKGLKECDDEVNPNKDLSPLKFRLDLHC